MRSGRQFAWIIVACAALAAQATPMALCLACNHPCCVASTDMPAARADGAGTAGTSGCPLCVPHSALHPAEAGQPPCRCQLDARQEHAVALSRSPVSQGTDDALASDVVTARLLGPQSLGISRDYAALSLAIPIRPARILFGVWRN